MSNTRSKVFDNPVCNTSQNVQERHCKLPLILSGIILKKHQTYFKNLAVRTAQNFQNMFNHFSKKVLNNSSLCTRPVFGFFRCIGIVSHASYHVLDLALLYSTFSSYQDDIQNIRNESTPI